MRDNRNPSPSSDQPEEDFEALFAEFDEGADSSTVRPGDRVKGTLLSVGPEFAFIALGGKTEGLIASEELADSEGDLGYSPGDEVEATVVSLSGPDGAIRLSISALKAALDTEILYEAKENRLPVEGRVTGTNKGGYTVVIGGKEAFCPISQMEMGFTQDPQVHVNKTYSFLITEMQSRRFVVSRSALLKESHESRKAELQSSLKVGDIVRGEVVSLRDFGAFVDLGGVQALAHVSQLSWSRVSNPAEVLEVGQSVEGKVTEIDWSRDRIGLSLREAQSDPWSSLTVTAGSRCTGTVVRLADFGAFVELVPGVEGLLHISEFSWKKRIRRPSDLLTVGQSIDVAVLEIDTTNHRISLGLRQLEADPWSQIGTTLPVGKRVVGKVESVKDFGVFVVLDEGVTGLIPNREMATDRGANHRKLFPEGTEVKVQVLEVDKDARRITLSRKALEEAEERIVPEGSLGDSGVQGMGTLGDLLKGKLGSLDLSD